MVVKLRDKVLHCESEYDRGGGCGKTARPQGGYPRKNAKRNEYHTKVIKGRGRCEN